MYSMVILGIGQMEIDWNKGHYVNNYANLFQPCDLQDIPYYYADGDSDEPMVKMKKGFSRKLGLMKSRLDLLGYDMDSIRMRFNELIREHKNCGYTVPLDFDTYCSVLKSLDLSKISMIKYEMERYENGYDLGEYAANCVLQIPEIHQKLMGEPQNDSFVQDEKRDNLAFFLENLEPYITLRILAENPANLELEVQWRFSDVVDCGWISQENVFTELSPTNRILIVTEGSSDSFILKKAIEELYPEIADFFAFIDMKENYPFTGTGNLYNFCMGLCRINVLNKIMIIFDNDTAGVEKYKQAALLRKPESLLVTKLPDYPDFCNIQTVGPQGTTKEDINGKAVAIECFLDFGSVPYLPKVRWTEYKKSEKAYQGELENKDEYVRVFKRIKLADSDYDSRKLKYLIEYLIRQWIDHR